MSDSVQVENNTDLKQLIAQLESSGGGRTLEDAVAEVIPQIWTFYRAQISRGIGYKGGFKSYSKSYEKWKSEKYGRGNPPDLLVTGRMLNSFTTKTERLAGNKIAGVIFSQDASQAEKIEKNNSSRPFLGTNEQQLKLFEDAIREWLTTNL